MTGRTHDETPPARECPRAGVAVEARAERKGREWVAVRQVAKHSAEVGQIYRAADVSLHAYLSCEKHAVYWSPGRPNKLGGRCPFCTLETLGFDWAMLEEAP